MRLALEDLSIAIAVQTRNLFGCIPSESAVSSAEILHSSAGHDCDARNCAHMNTGLRLNWAMRAVCKRQHLRARQSAHIRSSDLAVIVSTPGLDCEECGLDAADT